MSASAQNESSKNLVRRPKNKDDQEQLANTKQSKFAELIGWLQSWGYGVVDNSKYVKMAGIEFQAEITPQVPYSSGLSTPFYLEFQDDLNDGFILHLNLTKI